MTAGQAVTNLAVAAAVVLLGIATVIGSFALGIGTLRQPDSGTWPLIIGLALTGLGVALAARFRLTHDAEPFTAASVLVVAGLGTMVGFVALIGTIGFEVPSFALMIVWLRWLGRETWRSTGVVALASVAAFYLLFVGVLAVPVPHLL